VFDFSPGDDLELIVATTRELAERELAPALRRNERTRRVAARAREACAAIGLDRLELPDALGGTGHGAQARVAVNEELAAADAGAALALDPLGPALYPLLELGGVEALRLFAVPLLGDAEARAVLITDGDARLEIGEKLSGHVPWVPADRVDLLVVLHGDEALVIRERLDPQPLRGGGLHAAGAAELRIDRAPIAARWTDAAGAVRARARARLYMASLLTGVLRQAADFSREYALGREAFGRPIAHHQALAFLITDMRTAVDGARVLLQEAAWRVDNGLDASAAAAAAAFVEAIEASRLVGPSGVQILGGHGFMQDHPVEKYMRDARLLGLTLGGVDPARDDAAGALADGDAVVLSHFADREHADGL
jgi:alkylation response protein AidB-like acyl-CoA dehydrogenase